MLGAAWTVPAVAVAAAAPAFAASGCYSVSVSAQIPNNGYDRITLSNPSPWVPAGTVITWTVQNVGSHPSGVDRLIRQLVGRPESAAGTRIRGAESTR